MRRRILQVLAIGFFLVAVANPAHATTLTLDITVDNGYYAYISTSDAVAGVLFGSGNNWPTTFTHTTTLSAGVDYFLHIYGYDQGGIAGFLAEVTLSGTDHKFANNGTTLLTNTTDWHGNITGWGQPDIALTDLGANGVSPWGTRPNIPSSARWIWAGNANDNNVAYFSTKISATAVSAPSTLLLFSLSLGGLVTFRKRLG